MRFEITAGEFYYNKTGLKMKAGAEIDVEFIHAVAVILPAGQAGPPGPRAAPNSLLPKLLAKVEKWTV
jgi:hypothetical protein